LQYVTLNHTEVLTNEGTTLNFSYADTNSQPGTPQLRLLNYKSESNSWSLNIAHPFIRSRQENLSGQIKYDQRNVEGNSLNTVTLHDKIRSLRFGLNYDKADAFSGINQVLVEYSFGLGVLGATDKNSALKSRADGKSDYQKLTVNLSRRQDLGYFSPLLSQFSLNTAFMGQYSSAGLLSSEECGIGGRQFGKAYDSSEILGDSCLAGSVELAFSPNIEGLPFKYAQFYGFYDGGTTTNVNPLTATDSKTKNLMSTGGGFRFGITDYVSGLIEGTLPLTRIVANQNNTDPRIFASISARF
jgi:hemolysin activation/secretion protein